MHVHRQNRNLERGDSVRPQNPAIVKVLLNGGRHHARHTDTVAAHRQDLVTAIFALYGGFHRFRVLGTQLEDVAHFDTAFNQQRTFTIRARVTRHDVTDISHFRGGDVAIPVDAEVVFPVDVSARGEIAHCGNGTVDNHRNGHINRAQRTGTCLHQRADLFFGSEGQRAGDLWQFFRFNFVQLMIAANQQGN